MPFIHKLRFTSSVALAASLLLAGCAVGPNFKEPCSAERPRLHARSAFDHQRHAQCPPAEKPSALSRAGTSREIGGRSFIQQPLNDLIERSLKANPDLKAAQAALVVARENVLAQRGAYYPQRFRQVSRQAGSRHRPCSLPCRTPSIFNFSLYTPEVSCVVCAGCVWPQPANGRVAEGAGAASALCAGRDAHHAELQCRGRGHSGSVLARANRRDAGSSSISTPTCCRSCASSSRKGYASRLDVAAQESQLAQVAATLPPLLKQLAQQRDLLAELSGGFPSQDLRREV